MCGHSPSGMLYTHDDLLLDHLSIVWSKYGTGLFQSWHNIGCFILVTLVWNKAVFQQGYLNIESVRNLYYGFRM